MSLYFLVVSLMEGTDSQFCIVIETNTLRLVYQVFFFLFVYNFKMC